MTKETGNTESSETAALEDALEHDQASHGGHPEAAEATNTQDKPVAAQATEDTPKPKAGKTATKPQGKKPATPPRKLSGAAKTQRDAKAAREKRLEEAEDQLEPPQPPSASELAELERKAGLQDKLIALAEDIAKHEKGIEDAKTEIKIAMAELYPQAAGNDRHVDAVRGYLKSSQEERQVRGAHPYRLKELLLRAGKAPIDAAFQRARARGQQRPTRSPIGQGNAPAADQAKEATPGAQE